MTARPDEVVAEVIDTACYPDSFYEVQWLGNVEEGMLLVPLSALQSANARLAYVIATPGQFSSGVNGIGELWFHAQGCGYFKSADECVDEAIRRAAAGEGDANQGDGE